MTPVNGPKTLKRPEERDSIVISNDAETKHRRLREWCEGYPFIIVKLLPTTLLPSVPLFFPAFPPSSSGNPQVNNPGLPFRLLKSAVPAICPLQGVSEVARIFSAVSLSGKSAICCSLLIMRNVGFKALFLLHRSVHTTLHS
ncbi:hypothetical protein CDAR_533641 [Caerostris darwini]|uniref:Uncharacterized protein n=1 Tax=Caerostris darwini TaxID=1538125 RepID=A0AAV4S6Y5_9ARAC|nr:hypothetical protein CDAR_533641 [Caerostris darwini]